MISLLAWAGFVASFLIHVGTFFPYKMSSGIIFLGQGLCILLYLAASFLSGIGFRQAGRNDCAGVAADLLLIFEPYALLIFIWFFVGMSGPGTDELALRFFSCLWMNCCLTSAGLMARSSLGIRQFS